MNTLEIFPKDPTVALYVDRYQFYDLEEASFLKTLPNGKFDSYYISNGSFSLLNPETQSFEKAPRTGLFLASNHSSLLQIEPNIKCINIKLKISTLAHPDFNLPKSSQSLIPFSFPYSNEIRRRIDQHFSNEQQIFTVDWLDQLLKAIFIRSPKDEKIIRVLREFSNPINEDIGSISQSLNMSTKGLYRLVKMHFSLSPKQLKDMIRFDLATSYLKNNSSLELVDALSFGYYDQSHFVKECRKITGLSPKKLFANMPFTTNDLIRKIN